MVDFHGRLSDESVYQRYFTKLGYEQRVAHERLVRVCFTDYDREIALVAERLDPETDKLRIAGIARLIRLHNSNTAEFSLIVADDYQGHGLGTEMVRRLIEVGREEGHRPDGGRDPRRQRRHGPDLPGARLQHQGRRRW